MHTHRFDRHSAANLLAEVAAIGLALLLLAPDACSSNGSGAPTENAGSGGNSGGSAGQAGSGQNGSLPAGGSSTGAAGAGGLSTAVETGGAAAGTSGSSVAGGQTEIGGSATTGANAGAAAGAGTRAGAGAGASGAAGVQGGGTIATSVAGAVAGETAASGKAGSNGGSASGGAAGGTTTTAAGGKAGSGGSAGATSSGGAPSPSIRQTLNFNQAWKFKSGDYNGAQAASYADTSWTTVGLPHSFSLPYFMSSKFYVGYGWYRKHFTAPAEWSSKRVFLEFEGAFQDAQVYVNGKSIGEHKGGYSGFSFDITSAVVTGDNLVAVQVNNNWNAQLAPRAGDHTFSGGL